MEMELAGDTLFLHGASISTDDWITYQQLTRGKQFSKVVLVNQTGGDVPTALGIALDLVDRRVTTILLGYCYSACTYIFLGGEHRQFSNTWPLTRSRLGFHGVYDKFTNSQSARIASVGAYYESRVQKEALELLSMALVQLPNRRGLLFTYHPSHRGWAALCPGSVEQKCRRFDRGDAATLGLITTRALIEVDLPERFAAKEQIFGVEWSALARLSQPQEMQKHCPTGAAACAQSMRRYAERPAERAVALSDSGKTGVAWNFNHPRRAAWRALYECARRSSGPCRIFAINDYLAAGLYERWSKDSDAIREKLKGIAPEKIPEERYEITELRMRSLRTVTFSGTTPESIPGVKEVMTRQLLQMMTSPQAPLLVDVGCGDDTLPAAKCIFGAGLAYSDPKMDEARENLFFVLLNALAPDASLPVVFFSANANSWLAANAAFRAARAAHNVLWYRGGVAAWRSADLPTVPTAPVGAVTE